MASWLDKIATLLPRAEPHGIIPPAEADHPAVRALAATPCWRCGQPIGVGRPYRFAHTFDLTGGLEVGSHEMHVQHAACPDARVGEGR
jgi:hypothetical protein